MKKEIIGIFLVSIIWITCSEIYDYNKSKTDLSTYEDYEIDMKENLNNHYIPEVMPYTEKHKNIKPEKMPVTPKDKKYNIIPL